VPKKIYPLTSVRFVAASLVLFHHSVRTFLPAFSTENAHPDPGDFVGNISLAFSVSVSFFFLLSGYVLSLVYLHKGHAVDQRSFFVARFARIYPLYLVALVLDAPDFLVRAVQRYGMTIGLTKTAELLATNAFLLQAWYPARLLRINVPSWSLCGEVFFYICFPLLGTLLWKLRGAHLWTAALALYAGGQALVWGMRPILGNGLVLHLPLMHLSTFALGILLARWQSLQREREGQAEVKAWQANTVLGLSIGGFLLSVPLQPFFRVMAPYNNGMLAPVFAGIIWALSATPTPLSRWLCGKWLVTLGNSSYALYLIHIPILDLFVHFKWVSRTYYPEYLALCVGLSLLSFHFFETPIRLWLTRRFHAGRLSNTAGTLATARPGGFQSE
jgi:peptidoglycan/LPS O-acetylase OafA/YrhL